MANNKKETHNEPGYGSTFVDARRKSQIISACDSLHELLQEKSKQPSWFSQLDDKGQKREIAERASQLFDVSGNIRSGAIKDSQLTTQDLGELAKIIGDSKKSNFLVNYNIHTNNNNISKSLLNVTNHLDMDNMRKEKWGHLKSNTAASKSIDEMRKHIQEARAKGNTPVKLKSSDLAGKQPASEETIRKAQQTSIEVMAKEVKKPTSRP